jgi:putative photosynthetic complex assembly protein
VGGGGRLNAGLAARRNRMSKQDRNDRIPRPILIGAGALLAVTIVSTAIGSLTGLGTTMTPTAAAVESRNLHFADRSDGGVDVTDVDSGVVVYVVPPGTNGFLRGVIRGMSRVRKLESVGAEPAYKLTHWADGRLSLFDPETGREVNLEPFGPDNYRVFARLLNDQAVAQK